MIIRLATCIALEIYRYTNKLFVMKEDCLKGEVLVPNFFISFSAYLDNNSLGIYLCIHYSLLLTAVDVDETTDLML